MPYSARILILVLLFLPLSALTEETQNLLFWQPLYHQVAELEKAGDYPDAIVQYEQCLKIAEQTENKAGMAKSFIAIGVIRTKLADPRFGDFLRRINVRYINQSS